MAIRNGDACRFRYPLRAASIDDATVWVLQADENDITDGGRIRKPDDRVQQLDASVAVKRRLRPNVRRGSRRHDDASARATKGREVQRLADHGDSRAR
jgi:hypothetical protein